MTDLQTRLDQFGQVVYICPRCLDGYLTTLVDRRPSDEEIARALDWHLETCSPSDAPGYTPDTTADQT